MTTEIFVQTVPVGPRQHKLEDQWFAVIAVAMWRGEQPPPGGWDDLDDLLLPWRWTGQGASPLVWSDSPIRALLKGDQGWADLNVNLAPVTRQPPLAINQEKVEEWIQRPVHEHYEVKRAAATGGEKKWLDQQIMALATSWGAIPQSLRLLHYGRVELPAGVTAEAVKELVFCPSFGPSVELKLPDHPDGDWRYVDGNGSEVATLQVKELHVSFQAGKPMSFDDEHVGGPGRRLDFATYWFKAKPKAVPPPASDELGAATRASEKICERQEKSIPHPLSFTVLDREFTEEESDEKAWTKVAGVGLLLRRKGDQQPWLCMNGAIMTGADREPVLKAPHLAPLPLLLRSPERSEVFRRDESVEYAQEPLFAERLQPADHPAIGALLEGDIGGTTVTPGKTWDQPYSLKQNTRGAGNDRLLLHRLVYGESYEAACFHEDLAGGRPTELTKQWPWEFIDDEIKPSAEAICEVTYLRRVGVGHAEIIPSLPAALNAVPAGQIPVEQVRWPVLPANVRPLYLAIGGDDTSSADPSLGGRTPIVRPLDGAFEFAIRPPATSREVCERWALNEVALRLVLRDVVAQGGVAVLDDPASDCLVIEVEEGTLTTIPGAGAPRRVWTWESRLVTTIDHAPENGRSPFRSLRLAAGAGYSIAGSEITVPAPDEVSRIVRVSVYVALSDGAQKRFEVYRAPDGTKQQSYLNTWGQPKGGRTVLAPERFVVEFASARLPSIEELRSAFAIQKEERTLTLQLVPRSSGVDSPRAFSAIDRVEVDRLEWIYQGVPRPRPRDAKPGWPVGATREQVAPWEHDSLRELSTSDVMTLPTLELEHRSLFVGRTSPVAVDDYSKDRSSRYLKYRLRAFSRYAGLANDHPAYRAHAGALATAEGEKGKPVFEGWVRAYLRYEGPPPAEPAVLARIPLTDSPVVGDGRVPCPLLVVIDQAPFVGGIDEEMECEVLQYGRDPILSPEPFDAKPTLLGMNDGPYGHSRDTDAQHPLYTLGSYILHPPGPGGEAWDMAKVRFRRTHQWFGQEEKRISSGWTDPTWIQFLPPRSFGGGLKATMDRAHGRLTVTLASALLPAWGVPSGALFDYLLVVTHLIHDYRGREVEEVVRLVRTSHTDQVPAEVSGTLTSPLPPGRYRARLCELQVATDEVLPPDIQASLLDGSRDTEDAGFRITRISPPMDVIEV